MGVIRRRGDRQHPADRLDPVDGAVLVDEGDHGLDRRSSSAWAKYAARLAQDLVGLAQLAVLALQRLDPLALVRGRPGAQALVALGLPHPVAQRLARAADLRPRSSGSPPHCEACSPWWSSTIRTARARTSGEYGGVRFVMAPSSQELEPPENPVRFRPDQASASAAPAGLTPPSSPDRRSSLVGTLFAQLVIGPAAAQNSLPLRLVRRRRSRSRSSLAKAPR